MEASADAAYDALKSQVENLKKQLEQVQKTLKSYKKTSASKNDVAKLEKKVAEASEWKSPNTLIHMSGYADVGYSDSKDSSGSFNVGSFSPIFHFQYRDLVMLESELEFEVEADGGTNVALEYLTVDLFLNDYMTLVAGKFLSPIGQFRQNLHPSWINKLPSAPPGFGHDGAAPVSDLGIQLRGGFPLGGMRTNYAFYISNGPELNASTEDAVDFELEGIAAEGFGRDRDGSKVYGGRFGLLPFAGLEIGLSGATGKAAVTTLENISADTLSALSGEPTRDYDVYGFDFAWQHRAINLRGEFIESRIGSASGGTAPSSGANWSTWYAQAAYRFLPTKFEGVLRYTDFDSPHISEDRKQWVVGLNYLFASNVIAKFAYQFNDGADGSPADDDRWLLQLAYGF
ncbi:MAG TPA: hypothetical protein ENJ80_04645 [Gammaproteobacteria bacterium]|nr:hypothetical protein [Gammaproteobacteria bacterium]